MNPLSASSSSSSTLEQPSSPSFQPNLLMGKLPLAVLKQILSYLNCCETFQLRCLCSFFKRFRIQREEILFATNPLYSRSLPINPDWRLVALDANRIVYNVNDEIRTWDFLNQNETVILKNTPRLGNIAVLDNGAIVYGIETGIKILSQGSSTPISLEDPEFSKEPSAIAVLNATQIAFGCSRGKIRVWDLQKGCFTGNFQAHEQRINAIQSLTEQRLVTASDDHTLKVWNMANHTLLQTFSGHTARVTDLAVLDENHVVSASRDKTLIVWNALNGRLIKILKPKLPFFSLVALSTQLIAIASMNKRIEIWDAFSGKLTRSIPCGGIPRSLTLLNKCTLISRVWMMDSSGAKKSLLWDASFSQASQAISHAISEKMDKNTGIPFLSLITDYLFESPVRPSI